VPKTRQNKEKRAGEKKKTKKKTGRSGGKKTLTRAFPQTETQREGNLGDSRHEKRLKETTSCLKKRLQKKTEKSKKD